MTEANILIVEDDKLWQEIYQRSLRKSGYQITVTGQFGNAKTLLNDNSYDVVITDLKMLGEREEFSGFNILKQAISSDPNIQVIVITGYGSADHALQAMGNGAYDYITKDQKLTKKLPLTVRGALETRALKLEWASGKHDDDVELTSDRIIGNSSSMEELYRHVAFASESDINVLLFGESGTGKRLIAQTIHLRSNRKEYPFLVIDCGRLSESVLAGELFGYESGTLFGIEKARPGKFERANGGTIFLDGVGDLELKIQTRMVGTICDQIIERIGGYGSVSADIRFIASTDKDLNSMVSKNQFHRGLYDALNELPISVPSLRQRKDGDDISALAAMFLKRYSNSRQVTISQEALILLRTYSYPGNVRELESVIKYALTKTKGNTILPEHLRPEIRHSEFIKLSNISYQAEKDPQTLVRICPLNLGDCSKKTEILRLYSPRRIFVNTPDRKEYYEYEQTIREILESYGLVPVLLKDHIEPIALLCSICKLIQTCKYAITDVSFGTEVLYRMGLIHATGVHCAILKHELASLPNGIEGINKFTYSNTQGLAEIVTKWVNDHIEEAQERRLSLNQKIDQEAIWSINNSRISLEKQLSQFKKNLIMLQDRRSKFIDPRSVPMDLEESISLVQSDIERAQFELAKLALL